MIFYSTKIVILEKSSSFFKVLKFLEPSTLFFDLEWTNSRLFRRIIFFPENSEVQSKQYVYFKHIGHPET